VLSIGEEAGKGNDLTREARTTQHRADQLRRQSRSARSVSGRADVVVCDGFTGNVALKVGEAWPSYRRSLAREIGGVIASDARCRKPSALCSTRGSR
jgi:glycerol-3-phosphate acyltransferase PlsX